MKAIITKGKQKGKIVEVYQWCNDWFSIENGKIVSPSMLAFTTRDINEIEGHDNNGIMFSLYEIVRTKQNFGEYLYTFKKKKQTWN